MDRTQLTLLKSSSCSGVSVGVGNSVCRYYVKEEGRDGNQDTTLESRSCFKTKTPPCRYGYATIFWSSERHHMCSFRTSQSNCDHLFHIETASTHRRPIIDAARPNRTLRKRLFDDHQVRMPRFLSNNLRPSRAGLR